LLIAGAGARPAWIASGTARCRTASPIRRLVSSDGETGKLLLESSIVALRTLWLLLPQNDGFEAVMAFTADVFKNRHGENG